MVRNVQLAQVNHTYAGNAWLPYSAGIVQANAMAQPDLREDYQFARPIFLRDDPARTAEFIDSPDVVGISSYIWNWEWSKVLAQEIRKQYPSSLIVMGGPQIPNWSDGFFQGHPYVDILVHGEGECIFSDILRERRKENPDYSQVRGITFNKDGKSVRTIPRPRLTEQEISELRSPYLDGIFEELMKAHPELGFNVTSETHRGCPYSCEFCDWGSAVFQQIHKFSDERVKAEYDWIAQHKIEFVYNADANFILFPRDEKLTDYLIELNQKTGYPKQLRANWAKNTHGRIFNTAMKLNQANMDMGVTLSLQSLDEKVLEVIKRKNIRFDNFTDLVKKYDEVNIPTYTEIIIPLPGETYESFTRGLETLLEGGQHTGLNVYQLMLLPNSGMSHPEYMKRYGIKAIDSPILQNHSTPGTDPIKERTKYAVSTDSMPLEDVIMASLYGWAIQGMHSLGLTQDIAIHMKSRGIPYYKFYENFLASNKGTLIGDEVESTRIHLEDFLSGRGGELGGINHNFGNIVWPLEELSFLNIITGDLDKFYSEVREMVRNRFNYTLPEEVIQKQRARLVTPEEFGGDIKEYSKRIVWFGRKRGDTLRSQDKKIEDEVA
jgi:putative methyltransferase